MVSFFLLITMQLATIRSRPRCQGYLLVSQKCRRGLLKSVSTYDDVDITSVPMSSRLPFRLFYSLLFSSSVYLLIQPSE